MNLLEIVKLKLAGWSLKTFLGKYVRRGIRVGVSFVLGHLAASELAAYGVTVDSAALEVALEALIWSKLELLANLLKVKAEQSEKWAWVAAFL